jgi:hypothetical protein
MQKSFGRKEFCVENPAQDPEDGGLFVRLFVQNERFCRSCRRRRPVGDFGRQVGVRMKQARCQDCRSLAQKEERARREHEYRLAHDFSLTAEGYRRLLEAQGGVCAVCRRANGKRRLAVDHCHKTGAVRGLLCTPCNTALGALGDDVAGVQRMIDYLIRSLAPAAPEVSEPKRIPIVRYVTADGVRATKGTPGAVAVHVESESFYVRVAGQLRSLRTSDEAEARRRAAAIAAPAGVAPAE